MSYKYTNDRMLGHDYPGVHSHGFVQYDLDELEIGARGAMALDDPEQAWWETIGNHLLKEDMDAEAQNTRDSNANSVDLVPPKHLF